MPNIPLPLDRPSPALAGLGVGHAIRRAFFATRPPFLIASVLPVLVGTAWAGAVHHRFDGLLFGLALLATVMVHAATNVYNDVGDDLNGSDVNNSNRIYPYTGGSRFIQTGLMSRSDMKRLSMGLYLAALLIGSWLAALRGPGVMILGLGGLALGLLYSLPAARLSARGIGEAAVAMGLGVLPVVGAAWLQTGFVDAGALLLCIPVSCWVAAILIINEVPDLEADRDAHKRTLVVRFGTTGARWIYGALTIAALIASFAAIERHALPIGYGIAALTLAVAGAFVTSRISSDPGKRRELKRGIELTLAIQGAGCILIVLALLIERFVGR